MDWLPIETAPMDGTEILIFTVYVAEEDWGESFSAVQIARWDSGHKGDDPMWDREADWDRKKIGEATHWMPLPAPPLPNGEG